jgi:hypothetical protein
MRNTIKITTMVWLLSFICLSGQPGLTALAQEERAIYVYPSDGGVGDSVRVAGEGFNKSTDSDKFAAVFFSSQEATTDDDIDSDVTIYELVAEGVWLNENGEFDISFDIPMELNDGADEEKIHAGIYYIYVCHYLGNALAPRIRTVAEFEVVIGSIAIEPDKGTVSTSAEVTGTDFFPEEEIAIHYDGVELNIDSGDRATDGAGEFTAYVTIPKGTAGTHTITVVQMENAVVAEFTVEPDVTINPTSGTADTSVTILGTGFGRRANVAIHFDKAEMASKQTDSVGDFLATFFVPDMDAGLYEIEIDDGENMQTAKFTIISAPEPSAPEQPVPPAVIEINRLGGHVGAEVVVSGTGFAEGGTATIEYDNKLVSSAAINDEGVFLTSFRIPVSEHGAHIITVSDGFKTKELVFAVETEAPETPELLLGTALVVKEEAEIFIDWEDVTDESMPVTYTLQLASDAGFSAEGILLEKTGLTESEYLVESSINRMLQPRKSYYWRLRAVDSASNAGEWTETGEIRIAAVSQIPEWLMYLLAVIGGLFILFIWYLIRRADKRTG